MMSKTWPRPSAGLAIVLIAGSCLHSAAPAHAQPAVHRYRIERAGLFDAMHTSGDGSQISSISRAHPDGRIYGRSAISDQLQGGWSAWAFTGSGTQRIGLFDAEHTSPTGAHESQVDALSPDGDALGWSRQYLGPITGGRSPWVHRTRLGFTDAEHTRADGYRHSEADTEMFRLTGRLAGTSSRFAGNLEIGESAWFAPFDLTPVRVGLTDAEHTRNDGTQFSEVAAVSDNAAAAGTSNRYAGDQPRGLTAWLYEPGAGTVRIGLLGPEFTSPSGQHVSTVFDSFDSDGRIAGVSERYTPPGQIAWVHDVVGGSSPVGLYGAAHTAPSGLQNSSIAGVTGHLVAGASRGYNANGIYTGDSTWVHAVSSVRIGFFDAEHTGAGGKQHSRFGSPFTNSDKFSDHFCVGHSFRYANALERGHTAWVYGPQIGTVRVGLTDAEHTRADGYRSSGARVRGRLVLGQSERFGGSSEFGKSAWAWTPETGTVRLGLTDAEHTRDDGYRLSNVFHFHTSDELAYGLSTRYIGGSSAGTSWWVYVPGEGSLRLGLTDAEHTLDDGSQSSHILHWDGSFAAGTSTRANGIMGDNHGRSGWFYDHATRTTYPLVFAVRPSDGYANTTIVSVTPEGDVLGSYASFDGDDYAGDRAFLWSLDRGFRDLGHLVAGGLGGAGWQQLENVAAAEQLRVIAGEGELVGSEAQVEAVFALTATCPADFNLDGALDIADFTAFRAAFLAGQPDTDYSGDGQLTAADFTAFRDTYLAGCSKP